MKRLLATVLMMGIGAPAFAAGDFASSVSNAAASDFSASIDRALAKEAQSTSQQAAPTYNPPKENQLFIPGIALMALGGVVLAYGLVHETGADCTLSSNNSGTSASFGCETTHSTGVIVAGVAIAGAGGILLWKGEQQKSRLPNITIYRNGIGVRKRIAW